MTKSGLVLTLVILFHGTYGDPVMSSITRNNSSLPVNSRKAEWLSYRPTWTFPSLPIVRSFFGENIPEKPDEMKTLVKRVEDLEQTQSQIIEVLNRISKGRLIISPGGSLEKELIMLTPLEKIRSENPQVQSPNSQTPASTIVQSSVETNPITPSSAPEILASTSSEKSITSTSTKAIQQPTTPNSYNGDSENNKPITTVNSLGDHHASIISQLENGELEKENNSSEILSSFHVLDSFIQRQENPRINGRLPWNKDKKN